jgi:hypothetical protein
MAEGHERRALFVYRGEPLEGEAHPLLEIRDTANARRRI